MSAIELYYWGFAEGKPEKKVELHTHPYWQINIGISGRCIFRTDSEKIETGDGDLVIFPPGVPHSLSYPSPYLSYSFKFKADIKIRNTMQYIRSNNFTRGIASAVRTIMETTFPTEFFGNMNGAVVLKDDRYQILMEHFLSGVLEVLFQERGKLSGQISGIYETILSNRGRYITVSEAAQACGYSRNRFNSLIREQTGLSAKDFLNGIRLDMAKRFLRFTSLSIGEISEEMGFSTQFHFSDFFKRMTGTSPLQFRKTAIRKNVLDLPDSVE